MSAPRTVAELIAAARAAGHDALGIANDPEAVQAIERARRLRCPLWLYGEEADRLARISPSLGYGDDGWYFWDHVGTAAHGPYRTADEALTAAQEWRSL